MYEILKELTKYSKNHIIMENMYFNAERGAEKESVHQSQQEGLAGNSTC